MEKKKICIDVNPVVPLFVRGFLSGIGRTTFDLLNALNQLSDLPFEISLYSQNMKGLGGRNLNLSFQNKHLYFPHRARYNKLLAASPVREWFTGYDLMHITHNFEYIRHPEKTIVTLHDALFMKMQEQQFEHEKMRKLVPPLMRRCKAIITCSENSKRDIIETMGIHPNKIHVIPWGVRHDIFFSMEDKDENKRLLTERFGIERAYFFSVSCNMERKNTPRLIDCYIEFSKKNIQHDLCLVWDAPQSVRHQVICAGLQNRIHFIGTVDDDSLRLLYAGATATLFPSLYEGFGLPILESMACGTPVICSNTSSLPEVGGDAAIYVDSTDNQSIIQAMTDVENMSNGSLLDLSQRGVERAKAYSWSKCAQETANVYMKCLNQ